MHAPRGIDEARPRILVIDDERHQRDTVCRGLNLYGYRSHGVSSVYAALEALAGGECYDLVLTDLTMPGRSGLDLIERVRARWPDLPIVVATGLAASPEIAFVRMMGIPLLPKPFGPDALDATLRQVLASVRGRKYFHPRLTPID